MYGHDLHAANENRIDEAGKDEDDVNGALPIKKRDYDLVAKSLPVFSISSKAYQQLERGLDQCVNPVSGFINTEDTGIPALQAHTKALTMEDQIRKYKSFLTDFLTVLSSLAVVTAACSQLDALVIGPKASELTQQEKDDELNNLDTQFQDFLKVWSKPLDSSHLNANTSVGIDGRNLRKHE